MKSPTPHFALACCLVATSPAWSQTPPAPAATAPTILECPLNVGIPREENVNVPKGWRYAPASEPTYPSLAFMTYVSYGPGRGAITCNYDGVRGYLVMDIPAGCTPKRIGKWLDNRPPDRYTYFNQPYCSVKAGAKAPRVVCQLECP